MFGDLNRAEFIGNITGDIQLRATGTGKSVASFSIATNRRYQDADGNWQDATDFHNLVIWGKQAEMLADRAHKGTRVFIAGRLQTRNWDDAATGKKQYKTEVVVDDIILLDRYEKGPAANLTGNSGANGAAQSAPTSNAASKPAPQSAGAIDPDDLPF